MGPSLGLWPPQSLIAVQMGYLGGHPNIRLSRAGFWKEGRVSCARCGQLTKFRHVSCSNQPGSISADQSPRETATAEESQKIVHGSMAYYGSYTINETEKSMTMQMEGATFPNWVGTTHKRLFAISGDTLTITNPTPSGGGGVLTVVLKRAGQKPM